MIAINTTEILKQLPSTILFYFNSAQRRDPVSPNSPSYPPMTMSVNPLEAELEEELKNEFEVLKACLKKNQERADEFTLTACDEKMEKMTLQFEKARNLYKRVKLDLEAEKDSGNGASSDTTPFLSPIIL